MLSEKRTEDSPKSSSPNFSSEPIHICPFCFRELARNTVGELICIICNKAFSDPKAVLKTAEKQIQFNAYTSRRRFLSDFETLAQEEVFKYEILVKAVSIAELRADLLFWAIESDSLQQEIDESEAPLPASEKLLLLCRRKISVVTKEMEKRENAPFR